MNTSKDILLPVPDEELPDLKEVYKSTSLYPYINSLLTMVIKWRKNKHYKDYVAIYSPYGDWKEDGTFLAFMKHSCHDFYIFSKGNGCEKLCEALTKTKLFNWKEYRSVLIGVNRNEFYKVFRTLERTEIPIHVTNLVDVLMVPKENYKHFTIKCPSEVYVKKLDYEHIHTINKLWPHKYENSEQHLSMLIDMSCGFGVFLKTDDSIAAWIFQTQIGTIGVLQTLEEHKRKGYGSLLTAVLCKEISNQGLDPLGPVLTTNLPSSQMFKRMGFELIDQIMFTSCAAKCKY